MLRCSFRFNIRCCFLLSSLSVFLLRLIVRLLLKLLISPLPVRLQLRLAKFQGKSENGNVITISLASGAGGSLPSGYTGTRTILADVDYSSTNLRRRYITETWTDGVLTDSVLGQWETYHTAVEETL